MVNWAAAARLLVKGSLISSADELGFLPSNLQEILKWYSVLMTADVTSVQSKMPEPKDRIKQFMRAVPAGTYEIL